MHSATWPGMKDERGDGWAGRIHPEDREGRLIRFTESFEQRLSLDMVYCLDRHDGEYRWMVNQGVTRFGTVGSSRAMSALGSTSRGGRWRRTNSLIATLVHQLRNPPGPVRTGLDILKLSEIAREERQSVTGVTERQLNPLELLLDDLLEVSRITPGEMKIRRESVDLRDCLALVIERRREAAQADKRKFSCFMPDVPVRVEGNPVRLEQEFLDLITNAVTFTPAGASVRVDMTAIDREVKIVFGDGGIGIARGIIRSLFDIFDRGGRTCDNAAAGLGIGLSVVRSLVEHGTAAPSRRARGISAGPGAARRE